MYNDNPNEIKVPNEGFFVELNKIKQKITEKEWYAFRLIASKGISEEKDAEDAIIQGFIHANQKGISPKSAWTIVKSLVKLGLYDTVKISTGYRNFNLLKLTELGYMLYRDRFKVEPPYQEHEYLVKEHASIQHGYMIKDVVTILAKRGDYKSVSTNRKKNLVKLDDGRTFIPDVIGFNIGGYMDFFEVECGNHNQEDFNAKCNKMRIMKRISIIGQSRERVTNILKPQVDRWIKSVGRALLWKMNVTVYLYSISDFAKDRPTYFYNMSSDEPLYLPVVEPTEGFYNEE